MKSKRKPYKRKRKKEQVSQVFLVNSLGPEHGGNVVSYIRDGTASLKNLLTVTPRNLVLKRLFLIASVILSSSMSNSMMFVDLPSMEKFSAIAASQAASKPKGPYKETLTFVLFTYASYSFENCCGVCFAKKVNLNTFVMLP